MKARVVRYARRIAIGAGVVYLLLCVALYLGQSAIIFPGHFRQGTANVQVTPPADAELIHLQAADGTALTGLFGKAATAATYAATVIYFYGNGDALASSLYHFDLFRRLGCNCLIVDYEGYGLSDGRVSEQGCYAAAEAAYHYLLRRADVNQTRIIPAGYSLGGAVAIELAHAHQNEGTIAGLVTFSTFTTMLDMATYHYRWFPVSWLLASKFESENRAKEIRIPWFIGHGQEDFQIPLACADRLAAAAKGPVTRFTLTGANHSTFFAVGDHVLPGALKNFLDDVSLRPPRLNGRLQ